MNFQVPLMYSSFLNRLYAQLTSVFCKTDRIASCSGLLFVLHDFFLRFYSR